MSSSVRCTLCDLCGSEAFNFKNQIDKPCSSDLFTRQRILPRTSSVADSLWLRPKYVWCDRGWRDKIRLRRWNWTDDLKTIQFPTTSPDATLAQAIEFLRSESGGELEAVGIGSFGPIDLHSTSLTFGYVTSTPKAGWQNYNLAGTVRDALGVPVGFDTDVDAAALGEARWGAAQNLTDFLYLTVGTGIGGGAIVNGRVLHGLVHPEMGHIRVPHDLVARPFSWRLSLPRRLPGRIGLGSGYAGSMGKAAQDLPPDHPAWILEAHYLAHGLANWVLTLSPQRIVLGGGVARQPHTIQTHSAGNGGTAERLCPRA